ncbi:hypothetical protein HDU99_009415, partial [Rhizoclosmatium hyalinum]
MLATTEEIQAVEAIHVKTMSTKDLVGADLPVSFVILISSKGLLTRAIEQDEDHDDHDYQEMDHEMDDDDEDDAEDIDEDDEDDEPLAGETDIE